MKKLLVVTEVFWPESFVVNDLVEQFKEKGYQVDVLTQHPSYPYGKVFEGYENCEYAIQEWNGSIIYRFKVIEGYRDSLLKKLHNYYRFVRQGKQIVRRITERYDAVLVSQTGPLTVAIPAAEYAKRNGCPLYIWVQDIWPDAVYAYGFNKIPLLKFYIERFIRRIYSKCDKIFISSRNFESSVKCYAPHKSICYIPNWITGGEDEPSTIKLDPNKFNFTFTGNVSKYQNLENVIKGFAASGIDNAVLNIVGDGSWLDKLKEVVSEGKIENVVLHGRHPASHMQDVLLQSDVLILSLIADKGIEQTEPLKIQSYLRSGKPIFGVTNGSAREIIQENALGLCADPLSVDDISRGFREMIEYSVQNCYTVAENARKLIETRFNRSVIFNNLLDQIGWAK